MHVFYNTREGLGGEVEAESQILIKHDIPGLVDGYDHTFVGKSQSGELLFEKKSENTPFDAVIIEGHVGELQKSALKWASRGNVPVLYRSDSYLLYGSPLLSDWLERVMRPPIIIDEFSAFLPFSTSGSRLSAPLRGVWITGFFSAPI